jgi:Txe/YoeB family toxin of Txe-Axe toxin-antitoxin module
LCYYPTPDSIKTLVLIAAADFENYRTVHANWALDGLSQRPDWLQILDKAEKKYPELKQTRPVLEHWKSEAYHRRNPEIEGRANDLAISLLKNESDNALQSRLAKEALPNDQLVKILESGGQLSADDAKSLNELNLMIAKGEIEGYYFERLVRECIFKGTEIARTKDDGTEYSAAAKKNAGNELSAILAVSKKIIEEKENPGALEYLTLGPVVERIKSSIYKSDEKNPDLDIDLFLESYRYLPDLSKQEPLLKQFCADFKGRETIEFYQKIYNAFGEGNALAVYSDAIAKIARLVGESKLSPERAIELAKPIQTSRGEVSFFEIQDIECRDLALKYPEFLLRDNDGLDFLKHLNSNGIDALDAGLESSFGKAYIDSAKKNGLNYSKDFALRILAMQLYRNVRPMPAEVKTSEIDEENWKELMLAFIGITEGVLQAGLFHGDIEKTKKVFEAGDAKDACLAEMKKLWLSYLENGKADEMPFTLSAIGDYIKQVGGAGPLSQVESLSSFTDAYRGMLLGAHTAERTKTEVMGGMKSAEARFKKERWSNEDIADFYNVSRDVVAAAPSLFSAYFGLFEKLKSKDFKEFSRTLFPLHRVILSLSEKRDANGNAKFDKRDLVKMRRYIADSTNESGQLKPMDEQRKELMELILSMFRDKFSIVKVPENLDQEHVRSLTDISMYLANLSDRDGQKEDVLSFYLALAVNDKWDDYRRGADINPEEFLTAEKSARIKTYLENRAKLNPVTAENLGIQSEDMPEFMKILQEESENVVIGNVETVDAKLNNVISNLKELEDLDLYPDPMDKQRMSLLLEYGNKNIGAVSSKIYQQLTKPGKSFEFPGEDAEIRKQIEAALAGNSLELTAENVKKYFQEEIKPLAVVANILRFVEEIGVEKEISELRNILKPSNEVIAVFNRIGEEFKTASGAIAISQDLEYLDNLIVKKAGELSEQEMRLVKSYLAGVSDKLAMLEGIYDQVGKKFASMKQGQAETKNQLLKGKLEDISKIISRPESQQMIASTMTTNLSFIIENIRECLSCVRQGANNDTNLTFGDSNKFYLYSKSDIKAGSISDEIAFFELVTFPDGGREMAFVLDRVYGTNTPAILMNQVEAVYKKYAGIKRRFPDSKVSILVSASAIKAGGISEELFIERLKEKAEGKIDIREIENVEVDVAQSAAGDHYIEFGGGARSYGKRAVNGVLLKI